MKRLRLGVFFLCCLAGSAKAKSINYVISIGNNAPPASSDGESRLRELHYADDDAAAIFSFLRPLAADANLLTILDDDSQRRFPDMAHVAHPPSLVELRRVIATYRDRFEEDRRRGDDPILFLFYSGHGSRPEGKAAALSMLDGPLTQSVLYDEILAVLPARYVHLLVDACYAEAVVRPRDLQAQIVDVSDTELQSYASRQTLARFPNVGAVIATSSAAQTHEWDVYRQGVFSHELLSGLRGAADVNRDGRIEYSEISAFLAAANREVADERARLAVLARPPMVNRRMPIVDLHELPNAGRIVGSGASLGWFVVEDSRGNRLADVRAEAGFNISLTVPSGETLYLRNRVAEASVRVARGGVVELASLEMHPLSTNVRGALESALERGLFAAPFGPEYYSGFVDGKSDFAPVPLAGSRTADLVTAPTQPSRRPAWATFGVAGGLAIGWIVFAGLAAKALDDFDSTTLQKPAADARARFNVFEPLAITAAVLSGVGVIAGVWLWIHANRSSTPRATSIARRVAGGDVLKF
ncbi:MAG: hypothetical protein JWN44_2987 [Myxococcales bacterium]|nr:hypothetical protein [Myxococcales bacterium]